LRHALEQNFPALIRSVDGRRYIGVSHRSQVTFGRRFTMLQVSLVPLTEPLVLADVQTLGKAAPIEVGEAIPDLEPGVLQRADEAVIGAGAAEGQEMASGFEDAESFGGPGGVPFLRHSSADVGRTRSDRSVVPVQACRLLGLISSIEPTEPVPLLAHELQPVRRVGHDRVDRGGLHAGHNLHAVPGDQLPGHR
jgi:hypothetical protein